MIESFSRLREALAVLVEHADHALAFDDAPDTPQRQIELGGEFSQFVALRGGGGKPQLVVVATGELGRARQLPVGTGMQAGKLCRKNLSIDN